MNIEFTLDSQSLHRTDKSIIAKNSENFLYAHFEFNEEWADFTKSAIFNKTKVSIDENNLALVPSSELKGDSLEVSVYGTKDDQLITSTKVLISLADAGYQGDEHEDADSQLLKKIKELEEQLVIKEVEIAELSNEVELKEAEVEAKQLELEEAQGGTRD